MCFLRRSKPVANEFLKIQDLRQICDSSRSNEGFMGKVEVVYFADGLGNLIQYCNQGDWGLLLGQGR